MIQGYPDRASVLPGGTLTLHVSTDAPQFRIDFYQQQETLILMGSMPPSGWNMGQNIPPPADPGDSEPSKRPWVVDWQWPAYSFPVPVDWPSGMYIALFVEVDSNGNPGPTPTIPTIDGKNKTLFVVRSAKPGIILYKLPLATHHAYNSSGGGSLYHNPAWQIDPQGNPLGHKVTMHRPGGSTGESDEAGPSSQLDVPFIHWLVSNGYQVDYCIDLDIHENPNFLDPYNLLLIVGHDEYWSDDTRSHIEAFVQKKGNLAIFGGNTCWWHITYVDNNTAFVSKTDHKGDEGDPPPPDPLPAGWGMDRWWNGVGKPEESLTGVSFRNGAGWWPWTPIDRPRSPLVPYIVQCASHWVFEGTGLQNGDKVGGQPVDGTNLGLVGTECDGAPLPASYANQPDYCHLKPVQTSISQTPATFTFLAVAVLSQAYWHREPRESELDNYPLAATMGCYISGGFVFNAATLSWPTVLGSGQDPHVEQITRNVLNRLSTYGHSLRQFLEAKGVTSVRPLQPISTISVRSLLGLQ